MDISPSRRNLVQLSLMAGLLASPIRARAEPLPKIPPGPNPMFPEGFLKLVGFFGEDSGPDEKVWYEGVHAPDFVSFAAPYMARYARNWVEDVHAGGAPSFKVITEIQYKSEAAKAKVRDLMNSPAADALFEHGAARAAEVRAKVAPPPRTSSPANMVPVEPRRFAARGLAGAGSPVRRRIMLLSRTKDAGLDDFEAAVTAMGREIASLAPGIDVSLDFCRPSGRAGPADALVYVENSRAVALPTSHGALVQVMSVLGVETHTSIG